jgi:hypothetical protein
MHKRGIDTFNKQYREHWVRQLTALSITSIGIINSKILLSTLPQVMNFIERSSSCRNTGTTTTLHRLNVVKLED